MTTKDGLVGNPDHYCVNVNRALLEYLKNLIGSGKNKLKYLQINTKSISHLGIPPSQFQAVVRFQKAIYMTHPYRSYIKATGR